LKQVELEGVLELLRRNLMRVIGPTGRFVTHPVTLRDAHSKLAIAFCSRTGSAATDLAMSTEAGVVICAEDESLDRLADTGKTLIVVVNPRLSFIRVLRAFFAESSKDQGIDPTALIHPGAVKQAAAVR
jgi:UDP-3-O-[3-hydroxymyristoyl] glucosamine N-acyltransferase